MTTPDGSWSLEVFATPDGVEPFTAFQNVLDEAEWAALDAALTRVLAVRGIDLASSEWLKPLGQGLHEFRVRHTAEEIGHMFADEPPGTAPKSPILLRVFVHFHGQRIVLLLSGYDKQDDSSRKRQEREIARGHKCLTAWKQEEDRRKARERRGHGKPARRRP
jgi:hypothetical protein